MNSNPYQTPKTEISLPQASSPQSIKAILFSFSGRINRAKYWAYSILSNFLFYTSFLVSALILGESSTILDFILFLSYVLLAWINWSLQVKRWHDLNKSGWWIFISIIPLIGALWIFIECGCIQGTNGPNNYGEDPLQ